MPRIVTLKESADAANVKAIVPEEGNVHRSGDVSPASMYFVIPDVDELDATMNCPVVVPTGSTIRIYGVTSVESVTPSKSLPSPSVIVGVPVVCATAPLEMVSVATSVAPVLRRVNEYSMSPVVKLTPVGDFPTVTDPVRFVPEGVPVPYRP